MYIRNLILEGFKSYSKKTVVGNLSRHLNCITGRNGSGKSNIFDALCFVLGLSKIKQMRADGLRGLVYNHGSTGVQTATVSLVLDNSDNSSSPLEYKGCDEITVVRQIILKSNKSQTKCLINGKVKSTTELKRFFATVHLDIEHPNFLILQGTIRRIKDMKPLELLDYLQETAGTRQFIEEKEKATRDLEKKEKKLKSIDEMIEQQMQPELEKLRTHLEAQKRLKSLRLDLQRLKDRNFARRFIDLQSQLRNPNKYAEQLKKLELQETSIIAELDNIESILEELRSELTESLLKEVSKLEKQIEDKEDARDSMQDRLKRKTDTLKRQNSSLHSFSSRSTELEEILASKMESLEEGKSQGKRRKKTKREEEEEEEEEEGQTVVDVFAALQRDIDKLRRTISSLKKKKEKRDVRLAAISQSISTQKKQVQKMKETKVKRDSINAQIAELEQSLAESKSTTEDALLVPSSLPALLSERSKHQRSSAQLRSSLDRHYTRYNKSAVSGSPSHIVYGILAELIECKYPDNPAFNRVLEIVAGGALEAIVTNTQETASLLVDKGKMSRRTTILPLNSLHVKKATQKASSSSSSSNPLPCLASNLVSYPPHLKPVVDYVFGRVLVIEKESDAKLQRYARVPAFITLSGTEIRRDGFVKGGSRPSEGRGSGHIMSRFLQLRRERKLLEESQEKIEKEQRRIEQKREREVEKEKKEAKLAELRHSLALLESPDLIEISELIEEQKHLEKENEKDSHKLIELDQELISKESEAKSLEKVVNASTEEKKQLIEEARANRFKKGDEKRRIEADLKKKVAQEEVLKEEITSLELESTKVKDKLNEIDDSIKTLSKEIESLEKSKQDIQNELDILVPEHSSLVQNKQGNEKEAANHEQRKSKLKGELGEMKTRMADLKEKKKGEEGERKKMELEMRGIMKRVPILGNEKVFEGEGKFADLSSQTKTDQATELEELKRVQCEFVRLVKEYGGENRQTQKSKKDGKKKKKD
ncbi:structural maintenance of chromosomes protein 2-1, partial [Aduncisulcus paluster]